METQPHNKEQKKQTAQEVFKRLREKGKIEMAAKMQKITEAQDRAKANIAERKKKKGNDNDNEEWTLSEKKDTTEFVNLHDSRVSATLPFPRSTIPIAMKSGKIKYSVTSTDYPHSSAEITRRNTIEPNPDDTDGMHVETIETQQRRRKRRGRCTNCCGGLPGKGPAFSARDEFGGHCYCSSENRMRGGSDTDRSIRREKRRIFRARSFSEDSRVSQRSYVRYCCDNSSKIFIVANDDETRLFPGGRVTRYDSFPIIEARLRGGCGTCGVGSSSNHRRPGKTTTTSTTISTCQQRQTKFPCHETSRACNVATGGGCPCGVCGGPGCSDNPGGGGIEGGCCGRNRPRGLPCKCKCQSCDNFRPIGGCGGKSCGRIYSCAGSGGGRCCFPRNHKRRSGPDCCGGANRNCGGCC